MQTLQGSPILRTVLMSEPPKAAYVTEIKVIDPDTQIRVTIEIYKDPDSKGLFGVEELFLKQIGRQVPSPYNENTMLTCDRS